MGNRLAKSRFFAEIRESLQLAVPLASVQVAQMATGFVDTIMMGLLGSQTIAAGGLGAATFNLLLMVTTSILSAVSPLTAEAFGAGKPEKVGRVVQQGFLLAAMLAVPLSILIWNAEPLLRLLGQTPENAALAKVYLQAIAGSYLPALGFVVLKSFVSALSRPRSVMVIVACGTVLNILGNYVLMFGKLGLPAFGLAGIGLASTLSFWSMFLAMSGYILCQQNFQPYRIFHNLLHFERPIFWDLLHVGLPIGGLITVEAGLFTAVTFLMGQLGTVTLAAHQIALQTAAITFMVPMGISLATTVRVGQQLGQQDPQGAQLAGYIGIGMSGLFMGGTAIAFWLVPEKIVSLYLDIHHPANATVVALAKSLLGVAAVFQIVDGIQVAAAGALRGLKDTRIPMLIGILAYWLLGFTSAYILGFQLGLGGIGLWWGLAIGLTVAAAVLTWRFYLRSQDLLQAQWFNAPPKG